VDNAYAGNHAAAGDVTAFFRFVDLAAVQAFLADVVTGIQTYLEELRTRIDELGNELTHWFLVLFGQTLHLSITADVHRLFPVLEEDLILRQPVLKVLLPFSLQSFGPCQPWFFLFFCHTYLLLFFGLRIHVHDVTPLPLHPSLFTEITEIVLILMEKESACFL